MRLVAKAKGNRFEGFEDLGAAPEQPKSKIPTKSSVAQGKAKSKDPDFKKVTLYLSKELHLKMRSQTLITDEDMSELVDRVMVEYFKQLDG